MGRHSELKSASGTRRGSWKELPVVGFIALCLWAATARAQQVEMSSSLNPVGSGARATGMGGAFIGVADDATAASWNPAGLIQLEKPEVSIVHSSFRRTQEYRSDEHPEVEGQNTMDTNGVNYASAALPFVVLRRNAVASLNYQRLYELGKDVSFTYAWNPDGDRFDDEIQFEQRGFLYALSPAAAISLTPRLHVGATLNLWGDYLGANGWESSYRSHGTGTMFGHGYEASYSQRSEVSFDGVNAHLGLLWTIGGPLTVGLVYKTPFEASLTREVATFSRQELPAFAYHVEESTEKEEDLAMMMPASCGIGFAYRRSDRWTLALDVYWTDWSQFVIRDGEGVERNPLNLRPTSEGRLHDTVQVRAGSEYLLIGEKHVVPLRLGVFYDPEPATGDVDGYYGFSLGTGYVRRRFSLDASYQFRAGNHVAGDIPSVQGSSADVAQHTLMLSFIFYFE